MSTQIWVKTLKSQITDKITSKPMIGERSGTVTRRNSAHAPAPSTRAASYNSCGTWVMPAYRLSATKGTACHTIIMVMTTNASRAFWPVQSKFWNVPRCSCVRTQSTTPYWLAKSHCQTIAALIGGIAHASTIAIDTAPRTSLLNRLSSSATAMPTTMVPTTHAPVKSTVRSTESQNDVLVKIVR